jgi:hypothetical protein
MDVKLVTTVGIAFSIIIAGIAITEYRRAVVSNEKLEAFEYHSTVVEVGQCVAHSYVECAVKLEDGTYGTMRGPVMVGQPVGIVTCSKYNTKCIHPL